MQCFCDKSRLGTKEQRTNHLWSQIVCELVLITCLKRYDLTKVQRDEGTTGRRYNGTKVQQDEGMKGGRYIRTKG